MPTISVSKTGLWWGAKKWNLTIQTWKKSQGQFSNMAYLHLVLESTWFCSNLQELVFGRKCSLLVETRHFHKLTARWIKTATILINKQIGNSRVSLQCERKKRHKLCLPKGKLLPLQCWVRGCSVSPWAPCRYPKPFPPQHTCSLVACNSLPDAVFCSMSPGYVFMFSIAWRGAPDWHTCHSETCHYLKCYLN